MTYSVVLMLLFVCMEMSGGLPLVQQTKRPKSRLIQFQSNQIIGVKIGKKGIPLPMSLHRHGIQGLTALQFFLYNSCGKGIQNLTAYKKT